LANHPQIVLLGPAGATRRFVAPLAAAIRALDGDADVLAPMLPGRGEEPGPACESVEESAAWLERALAARRIDRALLVGHSYGGAIAIETALRGAVRVDALVLVSTGARLPVHPAVMAVVREHALGEAGEEEDGTMPEALLAAVSAVLEGISERSGGDIAGASVVADWTATSRFDARERVGALALPVAVLVGEDDLLTPPSYGRDLETRIAGATLEIVRGAGHLLPVDAPERVARAVLACRDLAESGAAS
jgi:pimeloyl-ACP methyl ester carboxylesterase